MKAQGAEGTLYKALTSFFLNILENDDKYTKKRTNMPK